MIKVIFVAFTLGYIIQIIIQVTSGIIINGDLEVYQWFIRYCVMYLVTEVCPFLILMGYHYLAIKPKPAALVAHANGGAISPTHLETWNRETESADDEVSLRFTIQGDET